MATRHYYSTTAVETTLTSGISDSATSIAVSATTGFPGSFPYYLALDFGGASQEVVRVTAGVGLTLTVTRGVSGTTGVAHDAGASVVHVAPSDHYNEVEKFLPINSGTAGLVAHTAADTFANRTLTSSTTNGLTITNGNGASGNPTFALQAKLDNIAASSSTGFWTHVGASAVQNRTITAASSKVTITNGNGVSGNPTVDVTLANFPTPTTQTFTANGTWNKPAGLLWARIKVQGGGGAGGGAAATGASQISVGGGGQGGHYSEVICNASDLGSSESITVGAGGVAVSGGTGGTGGTSSVGTLVSATGGDGGSAMSAGNTSTATGGGTGSGTFGGSLLTKRMNRNGGDGHNGYRDGSTIGIAGHGGDSALSGGRRASPTDNNAGGNGYTYGGGGSGARNNASQSARSGGDGGAGIVIIEEYYS
jgi:hypothetical protein